MARSPQKLRFGGDCKGFLYLPRDEAPAGAVVVLHERYGLVQHTLDLAQRFAKDGYVALAPDLFSRWRGDREALRRGEARVTLPDPEIDRKSTRLNSSHSQISYAVFCLKPEK